MIGDPGARAAAAAERASASWADLFAALGLQVFERGWLSSNNVLLRGGAGPTALVDTGYGAHAEQTVALVEHALESTALDLILNTHLHSDHCGGNASLQARWTAVETAVPSGCYGAAREWDERSLTFLATDQRCERFSVDAALSPGQLLPLGPARWEVHAAPGHDPTALMFFEPDARVLISADALWERRLAIIFPELVGEPGFGDCLATLETIERLQPAVVIPGHGRPFTAVADALAASRQRVEAFARSPEKHRQHAVRALVMFHMFEVGRSGRDALIAWLLSTPITASARPGGADEQRMGWAQEVVDSLLRDGALREDAADVVTAAS